MMTRHARVVQQDVPLAPNRHAPALEDKPLSLSIGRVTEQDVVHQRHNFSFAFIIPYLPVHDKHKGQAALLNYFFAPLPTRSL